ncbi:oxaloacetate-decarboxylating malate dehydrogenase [Streptomyces sp. M19]
MAAYVETVSSLYPHALLHFEDFGPANGRRILEEYGDRHRLFNDDLQGTGAITLAAAVSALRVSGGRFRDQRVVVFGAGTAGVGIADQLRAAMVRDGLGHDAATRRFWLVDKEGLLLDDMAGLRDYQSGYARPAAEARGWADGPVDLLTTVRHVRPTVLIGTSTVPGAFSEQVVRAMAEQVERPVIFPLSNPTERIEAQPSDLLAWTGGKALTAAGIPTPPVETGGVRHVIGQANNALVYPGIGLGTLVARAERVTPGMLLAAAEAVADQVDPGAPGARCCRRWRTCAPRRRRSRWRSSGPRSRTGSRARSRTTSSRRCGTPCGSRSTGRSRNQAEARLRRGGQRTTAGRIGQPGFTESVPPGLFRSLENTAHQVFTSM